MIQAVVLDAGPLSLVTQRPGRSQAADRATDWVVELRLSGVTVCVPEIADHEVRRELIRARKPSALRRLDRLKAAARYVPLTTDAMLLAAELWAQARSAGLPTADPKELDVDVILAAQALTLGLPVGEIVVATGNPGHLSRFVPAEPWHDIHP